MQNLTHLPYNLPGQIYRSPMPFGSFDEGQTTLDEYKEADIDTILMLTTPDEDFARAERDLETLYTQEGFETIRLPIVDFTVPEDPNVMQDILKKIITKAPLVKITNQRMLPNNF